MNRDTIERAASLIGGRAVTLGPLYDGALAGYTIIGNDAVAVYDYDLALEVNGAVEWLDPSSDPEDWLLDDIRETMMHMGVEPVMMRTNTNLEEGL